MALVPPDNMADRRAEDRLGEAALEADTSYRVEDAGVIDPDSTEGEEVRATEKLPEEGLDGHRPALFRARSTRSRRGTAESSGDRGLGRSVSRAQTVLSRMRSRPVPVFTHPLARVQTGPDVLVDFDGPDDPYRPINWPTHKKVATTLLYGLVTMTATWASSAYSAGTRQVMADFHVGSEVAILGTTLYLLGFGLGPLLWAPLSEVYGRRIAVLTPMFVAVCFSFGSATAKDFQTLMLTRFFCAFFASAPVTNTGGVLGDLFSPAWRGIAMAGYAMAVVGGPVLGPIVSAAVAMQPGLGWRWTEYLSGILQASVLIVAVCLVEESYGPVLLVYKAQRLRHETGNWALHTRFEEWDVSIVELARKFLVRPIQLFCTPICFLVSLYASFCYGILYMQLGAIPIIFGELRGWNQLVAELPFLSIFLGAILGCTANVYNQTIYNKAYHAVGNRAVPEMRLPPMMFGSVLFSAGQFLTGWTGARTHIHWIVPCIGLVMMGCGFFTIFQAALNYLVDTFQAYAASAIAATTFMRSCFAAAFPLVVSPLYHNIGVGPGASITGGFAALLIPVPFIFFVYGKRIRASSKWSKASVFD
ncbi:major facilitator superfamily transporter multidrug resistance [Grosmannia clavigera kw1407]|uniref:Major facilitator superfamily transporter multidrug resistance n=1 Tax=Grosmannia clavigera (strain kw1407 / UAMH 11150) TaxID=655863 RepID=F0XUK9_GROCL|nr:major facilitator superfamily transporter multidrug resistance [Grosmannia clavigera kw1407]EFW98547.1 major facilitator superfamily transporter multidrug resistance [Grosmannia clavigera kw1407]